MDEEYDWGSYESGPFCKHWSTPSKCERLCSTCGHPCNKHNTLDDGCTVEDCDCSEYEDEETKK